MTRSELPSVVRRKTSLTMRHRFTPASTFSTTTRALERRRLRNLALHSTPGLSFFLGLPGQHPRWLIALKTRVLPERRIGGIAYLGGIGGFLVVRFPGHRRPQIDHFGGVFVHQHEVLVCMGFLLAAVEFLLLRGVSGTLAP